MKNLWMAGMLMISSLTMAQNGPRMNMAERIEREMTMVFDSIPGLNTDQKLLLEQVYKELAVSVTALRDSGDMNLFRERMPEIQQNKNQAIRDILSEDQFMRYTKIMQAVRNRRRGNRQPQ